MDQGALYGVGAAPLARRDHHNPAALNAGLLEPLSKARP